MSSAQNRLVCLLGSEFSLSSLRSIFSEVEMVREEEFLLEYTPGQRLPASGRMGMATCRFVAQCAARVTPVGSCLQVASGKEAHFLAPLLVGFLPAACETLRRLDLLGIKTMGQLVSLGKDALYQQFEGEGLLLWELAQGIDGRLLHPPLDPVLPQAHIEFDEPCIGGLWLQTTLAELTARIFSQLQNTLCMGLVLDMFLEDHTPVMIEVLFATGTARTDVAMRQVWQKVVGLQLPAPILSIRLQVKALADAISEELSLFASKSLPKLRSQLAAKGYPCGLMQLVWLEPHHRLPEQRAYLQSLLKDEVTRPVYTPRPFTLKEEEVEVVLEEWDVLDQWWTPQPIDRYYIQAYFKTGACLRLFRQGHKWFQQ